MAQAGNYFCITNSYQLLIAQKPKFSTLQPCLTMNMTWDGLIRLSLSEKRPKKSPDTRGAGYLWLSQCTVPPTTFLKYVFFGTPCRGGYNFLAKLLESLGIPGLVWGCQLFLFWSGASRLGAPWLTLVCSDMMRTARVWPISHTPGAIGGPTRSTS